MRDVVTAILMVKDEEDIIEYSLRHLVDEAVSNILIADNMSTDVTRDKIEAATRYAAEKNVEIVCVEDNIVSYDQAPKMTLLAHKAHDMWGSEYIIPVDADECWVHSGMHLGTALRESNPVVNIFQAKMTNHFATALDPAGDNPFETMGWHQPKPQELHKVAFRYSTDAAIAQGNHSVSLPNPVYDVQHFEIRHFPYRSAAQMISKSLNGGAAYEASDLPYDYGRHWREYSTLIHNFGEERFREDVWEKYFWFFSPVDEGLIYDPAPYGRWNNA